MKTSWNRRRTKIKNQLNDLNSYEWFLFTRSYTVTDERGEKTTKYNREENRHVSEKSWFIKDSDRIDEEKYLHPAPFPESLAKEFILFFTKRGEWVLDPFAGTATTLVASLMTGRNSIGIELVDKWYKLGLERIKKYEKYRLDGKEYKAILIQGDARDIDKIWREYQLPKVKYVLTSPPYWFQLRKSEKNAIRQKDRIEKGIDYKYSDDPRDLGNIEDYEEFLYNLVLIFDKIYDVVVEGGYLTIIINNVYHNSKMYPLAWDLAILLSRKWTLKEEKIWIQDHKRMVPLGIFKDYVQNRLHQYCLIFKKETRRKPEHYTEFIKRVNLYRKLGEKKDFVL